jgi:hypothetical protein
MRLGARAPVVPAESFTHSFMNLTMASSTGAHRSNALVILNHLLHAGFLLGLFFDPKDGGCMPSEASVGCRGLHSSISKKTELAVPPL